MGHLNTSMIDFIETIRIAKMPIDFATILSHNMDEKLVDVKNGPYFSMTSYMVYLLVSWNTNYLGLYRKGSMQDGNALP